MAYDDSTVMQMAVGQMRYNMQRQTVLSHNIANVDTPNYNAVDLKPVDFGKMADAEASRLEMRATSPKHMPGINNNSGPYAEAALRNTYETTPTGNNVVLEQQMSKVNETGLNYQLASSIYRKMQNLFKTAIGKQG